jgi:hypothetical protein
MCLKIAHVIYSYPATATTNSRKILKDHTKKRKDAEKREQMEALQQRNYQRTKGTHLHIHNNAEFHSSPSFLDQFVFRNPTFRTHI